VPTLSHADALPVPQAWTAEAVPSVVRNQQLAFTDPPSRPPQEPKGSMPG
jgi:hypothetical protein